MFFPGRVFSQTETGGVENIFSYGAGLRAIGMGGAFIAMREDATLAYWNPGAMAFNQYKEVSVFGTRTIADSYYFAGFYTHPTMNFGTLSIGGLGLYTGGIRSYDEEAFPVTGVSTDYFHYQILLSYGYSFPFGLGVGGTAKLEQISLTDYKGTGGSLDLGAYYAPPSIPWLAVGAVVQDVIGTGIRLLSEVEQNTRTYKLGVATLFPLDEGQNTRLAVALDSRFYWDNYNPSDYQLLYDFSLGAEVTFNDFIMVRAGYRGFTFDSIFQNLPAGLSVGFGIRQWGVTLDYTVSFEDSTWQGAAELLMQLGISYRFGKSVDEQKKERDEEIQQRITEAVTETTENYEDEINTLTTQYDTKIAGINGEHDATVTEITKEYNEKIEVLETEGEEKDAEIARAEEAREEGIAQAEKAREEGIAQAEKAREEGITKAEKEKEKAITRLKDENARDRSGLIATETLKSERYARGLQLFSDGSYQEALEEFETVSEYDDEYLNVQYYIQRSKAEMKDFTTYSPQVRDIYYRGVDLFVQKKYEEAILEWKKILEIDPYNKLALRNIKEAENRLRKLKELGAGQ